MSFFLAGFAREGDSDPHGAPTATGVRPMGPEDPPTEVARWMRQWRGEPPPGPGNLSLLVLAPPPVL